MKIYLSTLWVAALLLGLLYSCTLGEDAPENGGITGKGITLRYTVEGRGSGLATYASVDAEAGEDVVQSLYLMFFEPSNDNSGQYIESIEVTGALSAGSAIPVTLPAGSKLTTTGAYNILAVANMTESAYLGGTDINDWLSQWDGQTQQYVMTHARARTSTFSSGAILPDELLMNGHASMAANTGNISLVLTRNQARFDVVNTRKAAYNLVSVSIRNAYPQSSVFGKEVMDYSSTQGRLRNYYTVTNTGTSGAYDNIHGTLYTFENEVPAPKDGDNQTTCLVIGLEDIATGTTTYYRVNVRPRDAAQVLKRNNVYRVTINEVFGPGAPTEEDAFTAGTAPDLGYAINYWDLDENGLIVQDGANILAIPSKTVRIGTVGGEFTYSIYTFSASGTPASPLRIKSQTWDPMTSDVTASLDENTLKITATPLAYAGQVRNGTIVLAYAGLEATVSVIQSDAITTFLELNLPGGRIPSYGSSAGGTSGRIEVRASGHWTAELYGDAGFSFANGSLAEKISSAAGSAQITDGKYFEVYTHTDNSTTKAREVFVVVTLDSDPVNYVTVAALKQNPHGGITVSPTTLTFSVANYATPQTVTVDGITSLGDKAWTATLGGANAGKFILSPTAGDGVTAGQTSFNVSTVEQNLSGSSYTATVRVALTAEPATYVDIPVTQPSATFTVSPGSFTPVTNKGGETSSISVNADPTFNWSATIATTSGTASDGRTLVNHQASLVDGSGNPITPGSVQSVATPFKVAFPKVYYPNREISNITATVTVTLHDAAGVATPMTTTFTVGQTALTSAGLYAANMNIQTNASAAGDAWGSLNSPTYETYYRDAMAAIFSVSNSVPQANTTFLHASAYYITNSATGWSTVETFRTTKDAVTVFPMEMDVPYVAAMNNANGTFAKTGYVISACSDIGPNSAVLNTAASATRVYKFLVTNGKSPVSTSVNFYRDAISTEASTIPSSAVSIIKHPSNNNSVLAVDPANRIVYIGELQAVGYTAGWNTDRQNFLNNLALYIRYAAEYGSHFTDLLNDSSGVPDLWDPVWGSNATY